MQVHRMTPIANLKNADGTARFADQYRLPLKAGNYKYPAPQWPKTATQIQAEAQLRLRDIEVIADAKRRLAAIKGGAR